MIRVGWMMRNAGIFGSRRECFELGNALVRRGHQFIYFSEDGSRGDWLPNVLEWKTYADIPNTPLDILVWSDTVEVSQHHEVFFGAPAKVKSYCIMGFDPNICENRDMFSDPLTDKVIKNSWVIADSDWQLPYMSIYTDDVGVSIGGVNLNQFRPVAGLWKHDVMWSGDMRERKNGKQVMEATKGMNVGTYFKKRLNQDQLVEAICSAPIFVDAHKRGGHCNPVLEAMACGRAVVCTDTPCTSAFAIHEETCLKVPVGDVEGMRKAIERLMEDPILRSRLMQNAMTKAKEFDYDIVAERFEKAAIKRLYDDSEKLQH